MGCIPIFPDDIVFYGDDAGVGRCEQAACYFPAASVKFIILSTVHGDSVWKQTLVTQRFSPHKTLKHFCAINLLLQHRYVALQRKFYWFLADLNRV